MTIRRSAPVDMPHLLGIARKFHDAAQLPFEIDLAAVEASLLGMMKSGCVLVTDGGAIGGVLGPAWTQPQWIYAVELFWWSEDGQGLPLLRGFEDWARGAGAKEIRMTSLASLTRAHKVLERSGYQHSENSYGRVL